MLGDALVVLGKALVQRSGGDHRGDERTELLVQAGDGVLGGVDDGELVSVLLAEDLSAVVEFAALVLALEQGHGDAGLEELERAVEEASYRLTLWSSWPQAQ